MTAGIPTNLADIIAVAREHRISPEGCMPNPYEPDAVARRPWDHYHVEQVELCRAAIWDGTIKDIAGKRWSRRTSYGYKHDVERAVGRYIANGSMVVAAILECLEMKSTGINACFRWPGAAR